MTTNTRTQKQDTKNLPATQKPTDIALTDSGEFHPKSISEMTRVVKYYIASGLLPREFNTPEKAIIAYQYCNTLGLKFSVANRQLCVINGKPSLYGDLPLSVALKSGVIENMDEFWIDDKGERISFEIKNLKEKPYAAVCIITTKHGTTERFFSRDDAQAAGLLNGNVWRKYTKDMLKYRARSQALKDSCPDVLNGVSIAEFDYGTSPAYDVKDSGAPAIEGKASRDEESIEILNITPENSTQVDGEAV